MNETENPRRLLIKLRVALGVLGFLPTGVLILLAVLPPELWPDVLIKENSEKLSGKDLLVYKTVFAVFWFTICGVSASLFAFSLLAKRISRQAILVALYWTGTMVLTGIVALAVLMLFTGFLNPFAPWITRLLVVAFVIAIGVSWSFLLRSQRYKEVTGDPDASLTFFLMLLCGGYVAWVAGMAFLMFALTGL